MTFAGVKRAVADRLDGLSEHGAEILMDLIRFPSVCGEEMGAVSCDARLFSSVSGIPAVTLGPGELVYAHSAQEQVRLSEIFEAARLYAIASMDWCGVAEDAR